MFRRVEKTLEPDPTFPQDLKQLGFFVNKLGQVRSVDAPEKPFLYRATNNERVNTVREEAVRGCLRNEVEKRLSALGLNRLYLPNLTESKPTNPSLPILAPPLNYLKAYKRMTIVINDSDKDLGILTWHQLQRAGLNNGSLVNYAKEMIQRSHRGTGKYAEIFDDTNGVQDDSDIPALVVLNPGQLLYSHKRHQAMTLRSWNAVPRKSAAHDMVRIHEENRVEGHETPIDHIRSALDVLLSNSGHLSPDAEIYIVAMGDGADNLLTLLQEDFCRHGPRITGLALVNSLMDGSQMHDSQSRSFLHRRSRHWKSRTEASDPLRCTMLPQNFDENQLNISALHERSGTAHSSLSSVRTIEDSEPTNDRPDVICPTFAAELELLADNVFAVASVQRAILSFFEEVACNSDGFCNAGIKAESNSASVEKPMELSSQAFLDREPETLPPEMLPSQQEIAIARKELDELRLALDACPEGLPELEQGLQRLTVRIGNKEAELKQLSTKALASGGLPAGEAREDRENWKPETVGTKIPFAGTMVDSELLKAAGFLETVESELPRANGSL